MYIHVCICTHMHTPACLYIHTLTYVHSITQVQIYASICIQNIHTVFAPILTHAHIYTSAHISVHTRRYLHMLTSCILQVKTTTCTHQNIRPDMPHFCMGTHTYIHAYEPELKMGTVAAQQPDLLFQSRSPHLLHCDVACSLTWPTVTWPAPGSLTCYTSGSQPMGHNPLWGGVQRPFHRVT